MREETAVKKGRVGLAMAGNRVELESLMETIKDKIGKGDEGHGYLKKT